MQEVRLNLEILNVRAGKKHLLLSKLNLLHQIVAYSILECLEETLKKYLIETPMLAQMWIHTFCFHSDEL